MENNESPILSEEQTEAVTGGCAPGIISNAELDTEAHAEARVRTQADLFIPTLEADSFITPTSLHTPASDKKSGLLGWFKRIFGNI